MTELELLEQIYEKINSIFILLVLILFLQFVRRLISIWKKGQFKDE